MNITAQDWTMAPVTDLIDHIVAEHHEFLKREMPRITALMSAARPAGRLVELETVWAAFVEEMTAHLWKEEMVLFPMVRALQEGQSQAASHCGGVMNPLRVMLMEHDSADQALRKMRTLTGDFQE